MTAQQAAPTQAPAAFAEQAVDIPALRELALQAILAQGFTPSDAETILEVTE